MGCCQGLGRSHVRGVIKVPRKITFAYSSDIHKNGIIIEPPNNALTNCLCEKPNQKSYESVFSIIKSICFFSTGILSQIIFHIIRVSTPKYS